MKSKKTKTIQKISLVAVLALLITMALAVSVMANETTAGGVKGDTCYTIGDVNGDGEVSKKDAVYLLYHSLFGDAYPIEQDGDLDGDKAEISGKDALFLLLKMNDENSEDFLKEVHAYDEPVWTWKEVNGVMTATAEYVCACGNEANHQTVTAEVVVKEGENTAPTCTADGHVTYIAKAVYDGVEYTTEKTFELIATGHVFGVVPACVTHECTECDYTEVGAAHTLDLESAKEVVNNCVGQMQYHCDECDAWVNAGEPYDKHDYKAAITTEATCTTVGEKTYTCAGCGDTYTEDIPKNANHSWDAGVVSGDTTVYTCACGATKTTYNSTSATVDKNTLASGEVELNDVSVSLDADTLAGLGENVTIGAEPTVVPGNVSQDVLDSIGNNTVYNFTMNNGDVTDFDGKVTVKVPYTLQPGDDVDCIDIYYIKENGEVEVMSGTYSKGYVSFETNHFSYYTVTRLTPKQRCAAYGHSDTTQKVAATCTTGGYTLHICARCAKSWQEDVVPALGHDNKEESLDATCTTSGYLKTECKVCGDKKETVIAALGHDCDEETVEATCTTKGYTHYDCKVCDYEETVYDAVALGHDYKVKWKWDKKELTATINLKCQTKGCKDVVDKEAVVSIEKQVEATCHDEGYTNYVAKIKVGADVYEDTYEAKEHKLNHRPKKEWKHNALTHYKSCGYCGDRIEEAAHEFDKGKVTTKATCTEAGVKTYTCECGYTKTEEIAATGHIFKNGVCTTCKFNASQCDHETRHIETVEFTQEDGYCGSGFEYEVCECGEFVQIYGFYANCMFEYDYDIEKDENGYTVVYENRNCKECGLHADSVVNVVLGEGCTGTSYVTYKIMDKNEKVILEKTGVQFGSEDMEHPEIVWVSEEDLSKYGMCGGSAITTKCPCGINQGVSILADCHFVYDDSLSGAGGNVYICEDCGTKEVHTWKEEETGVCEYTATSTSTYYDGDTELVTYTNKTTYKAHENVEYTFDLDGTTCSDGYDVISKCKDCGYTQTRHEKPSEGNHITYRKEIDLSGYDLCVETAYSYSCPCGERSSSSMYGGHVWVQESFVESEEDDSVKETYKCDTCGLSRESTYISSETDDPCIVRQKQTTVYKLGKDILLTEKDEYNGINHSYTLVSAVLEGASCEDGVTMTYECSVCGDVNINKTTYHNTYQQASYDLAEYGLCGGTIEVYGCACGESSWWNTYAEEGEDLCEWYYYDSVDGRYIEQCAKCGIYREQFTRTKDITECYKQYITQYDFMNEYDVLLSVMRNGYGYDHDYVSTYVLDGEYCWDGYTVNETCSICDYTHSWTNKTVEGEHAGYTVERINLADYGFCGGTIHFVECPCGGYEDVWESWDTTHCTREYAKTDEEGTWYQCTECENYIVSSSKDLGRENCVASTEYKYSYRDKDGKELVAYTDIESYESHDYEVSFVLNGTTCSDGYTVKYDCKDCESSYENVRDAWDGDGHIWYVIERCDAAELGLCEGEIIIERCPCGQLTDVNQNGSCSYGPGEYEEETHTWTYKCTTCGSKNTHSYNVSEEKENCKRPVVKTYVYYNKDGEKVFEKVLNGFEYAHEYEETNVQLNGTSCEDGYTVTETCKDCGDSYEYTNSWHNTRVVKEYDLADYGACEGATITHVSCYCGENQWVNTNFYGACDTVYTSNEYVDEDGVEHNVSTETCRDCGLRYTDDSAMVYDESTCTITRTHNIIITVGKTAVDTFTYETTETRHDYETSVEYQNAGSTSCEDGVIVTNTCKNCGEIYTYETTGHATYDINRIDLSQYGSVCGAYLVEHGCLCGAERSVNLEDYECDFDWNSYWIYTFDDEYMYEFNSQYTSEGYHDLDCYVEDITCAVTDPSCGFAIHKYEHFEWDKENCSMKEYDIWQLGYDKKTGTCQEEIKVLKDTFAYHDYEQTTTSTGTETIYSHICKTCNSSYVETITYDSEGNQVKSVREAINTLYATNGEPQKYLDIDEYYIYKVSDNYVISEYLKNYYGYVYADGTEYWYSYDYESGWEDGECTRTEIYTDSNGANNVNTYEHHCGSQECVVVKEATCSQYGIYNHETECLICNQTVVSEDVHEHSPNGHWYSWDNQKQIYVCTTCGLESENGADGTVILEDLTAQYGNGTDYVIGYWNNSSIYFEQYVCVINDEDSVVLSNITITRLDREADGINAITFSKAEVAAAVAEAGITGDITVVFTPYGADGELDYAITITE